MSGHEIQSDIDYVGAFLFEHRGAVRERPRIHEHEEEERRGHRAADPEAMIGERDLFEGLSDAPPPISGYRPADVAGLACWNCGHFTAVGDEDGDGDIDGICNLFESRAEGEYTCDRFCAHADLLRQGPHTSWQEDLAGERSREAMGPSVMESDDFSDSSFLASINFAGDAQEEDGLIWKDILRTGHWTHTPTKQGVIKKPLEIIAEGESDPANGIISLSEIYRHFNEGAIPYVTVPLSDDIEDHKNIARLNTGFVRRLKLEKRGDTAVLRAGIDFTEPDVRAKVLRGTIPDVSAGVPFNVVRRSDNRLFKTVLDHVCLTRKPFVDKLQPFGIAASDGDELPVEAYEQEASGPSSPVAESSPPTSSENGGRSLTFRQYVAAIRTALAEQHRLSTSEYQIDDVGENMAVISHRVSGVKWEVKFEVDGEKVALAPVSDWKLIEVEEDQPAAPAPLTASDALRHAHELRELRLSQPTSQGGISMSDLTLDGVELSDVSEEARARIQSILNENVTLRRDSATTRADARIEELKAIPGLNFADRPGALKLYRQVMLSDDGGPAIVLFSDSDDEEKKERLTALGILDRFIEGLSAGGDVQFSDQHLASGNDTRPPKDAADEKAPLDERVENSRKALYGDKNKRRTGRR